MIPYLEIHREYTQHPREQALGWYIAWHMENGFVFSTPDFFIMGRPAVKLALKKWGPVLSIPDPSTADCWYIHAMAGNMAKAWTILPYDLEFVGWERMRGGELELTTVPLADLRRLSLPAA